MYVAGLIVFLALFSVHAAPEDKILVLLDTLATKETHSVFFQSLSDRGFQVTYKLADDSSLALTKHGELLFQHLALFSPSVEEFGGSLDVATITDFVDRGGNVLVGANSHVEKPIRELAIECGVEIDEAGTAVVDHFNFDAADEGMHTQLLIDSANVAKLPTIVGSVPKAGRPILFSGVGMVVDDENPLVISIVNADSTAFSHRPDQPITEFPHSAGRSTSLVAPLQARNNARVLFVGSIELFSNAAFTAKAQHALNGQKFDGTANRELADALSGWVFKRTGILRVQQVRHYKADDSTKQQREMYTIKDDVMFQITIESLENGRWMPFGGADVQLEFVRIDPFVRITLKRRGAWHEAKFKVPDVYGVYKFKVDYNRRGFTHLFSATQVSVRPFKHTEFERYIPTAYPYYLSVFSMMLGVCLFSFVFLYHKDEDKKKKNE